MTAASVEPMIRAVCAEVADLLAAKNAAYGNSALAPVRIFSRADPIEQLRVRIDDKLSRLARGDAAGEDVEWDLLGYLVLLRVARRIESAGCGDCARPHVGTLAEAGCRCGGGG